MDYNHVLRTIQKRVKPFFGKGKVATYIPALANVDSRKFGMAVYINQGELYTIGDAYENFSVQSISKVLMLSLAIDFAKDQIWARVGKEPSGNPFNSLVQLEYEQGKPRNPFINAGAMVVDDVVISRWKNPKENFISFVRKISGNEKIDYDLEVAASEKETGFRNAALANFLKSYGRIKNDVEEILDLYFHQCSLSMSCVDLAKAFSFLSNEGFSPICSEQIISKRQVKRINALMLTCGLYDAVGDFAYWVGLPAKSGVGGGIAAVIPKKLSVVVWSPELNKAGNSYVGTKALEYFTTLTEQSIF